MTAVKDNIWQPFKEQKELMKREWFFFGATALSGPGAPHSRVFLDHTQRRTTVGRTPLDEWSVRRRDLYLTTHNTHNKHPCPRRDSNPQSQQASGRRPTPLDRAVAGTGRQLLIVYNHRISNNNNMHILGFPAHCFLYLSHSVDNVRVPEDMWRTHGA